MPATEEEIREVHPSVWTCDACDEPVCPRFGQRKRNVFLVC